MATLGHSLDSNMAIRGIGVNVEGLGRCKVMDAYAGKPLYDNVVDEKANGVWVGCSTEVETYGVALSYRKKQLARLPCGQCNRIIEHLGTHRKSI